MGKVGDARRAAEISRRNFLKASAAGVALPWAVAPSGVTGARHALPGVPAPADLASDRISYNFRDLICSPAAQNEWGYAKATKSVSGITGISFPPFACCGVAEIPWSPGFLLTCELFLNGRVLISYPPPADQVTYTWYPHRIVREARVQGLHFTTQTFMPSKQRTVAESIAVENRSGEPRKITLSFDLRAGVAAKPGKPWFTSCPGEGDNLIHWDAARGCLVFEAQHSKAVSIQGVAPRTDHFERDRMLVYELSMNPGDTRTFHYVNALAEDHATATAAYDRAQASFDGLLEENEESFRGLIRSAFTPGNSEFSGHLPQLLTENEALWRLYYTGFTNLLAGRRTSPDSAYGPTYLTLGGRVLPTLSFPWDTSLTALSLAMLDPLPLRRLVETWFVQDMHQHLATDYVSGQGVGPWYAANDAAILRCADSYLRVTGDFAWLEKAIDGKPVLERLVDHAQYWKQLDLHGQGLGDYGKIENLLEAVSTYLHAVAGMNAGSVYGMRFVASLLERRGAASRAAQLRSEARQLAARINQRLYVSGKGWWKCEQPDGSFFEVRHCYDLLTILDDMFEDLSDEQKREMSEFFWAQLHSQVWMRALSPDDTDATWNIRPDHSWLGAYTAWPSMTAKGLYKIDPSAKVAAWVKGLAKSANQGPFGQAHIVESVFPPVNGGAFKSPEDPPYFTDWCCLSGGSFVDLVVESIFGAEFTLFDGIHARTRLQDFDPEAKLQNVPYQGKNYTITRHGLK
jgi:hypothetical protein